MSAKANSWEWSETHQDHYIAEQDRKGNWSYKWYKDIAGTTSSEPRYSGPGSYGSPTGDHDKHEPDVPYEPAEQPYDPWGLNHDSNTYETAAATQGYTYGASPSTDVDSITTGLGALDTSTSTSRDRNHSQAENVYHDPQGRKVKVGATQRDRRTSGSRSSNAVSRPSKNTVVKETIPNQRTYSREPITQYLSEQTSSTDAQYDSISIQSSSYQYYTPGYGTPSSQYDQYRGTTTNPSSGYGTESRTQAKSLGIIEDHTVDDTGTLIPSTDGLYEPLDPSFKVIGPSETWKFYVPGRVFSTLWFEPAGSSTIGPSVKKYGELAYAKVRRFIVLKAKRQQYYSKCIAISTYGGRGVTKKNLDAKEHAIIFTGDRAPAQVRGEKKIHKDSIRVIPAHVDESLNPMSRVNLAKSYPVEHNVKVKAIGMVDEASLEKLISYWKDLTAA